MDSPSNEEGYTAPTHPDGTVDDITHEVIDHQPIEVHTARCCEHDSMILRLQNLQMNQQKLEFSIRELKDSQNRMMWKLVAVIGATSFICGWLGVHSWFGVLIA